MESQPSKLRTAPHEAIGTPTKNALTGPAFYDDLDETLRESWRLLCRGVGDRRSPFHTPTLATVRDDGSPSMRTLVLRAVDPIHRHLRLHTDVRSGKFREIMARPGVALHFYDPKRKIQLRIDGRARLHRDDAIAAAAWDATRPFSRLCYRNEPSPGREIADPSSIRVEHDPDAADAGRENFAVIRVEVDRLEWLYLAAAGHRRASFAWQDVKLSAMWLVP